MEAYYLETDLDKIKALAILRKEENEKFRRYLKNRNLHKTDALVHRINEEVAPRINCTTCGNCCKELSPYLNKEDLNNLAQATRKSIEEVIATYTEKDEEGVSFTHLPCTFLADNKCTIYQHRPQTCHSFPHLHNPGFTSRLRRVIDNYAICPIIFNVIERLKLEIGFQ